MTRQRYEGSFDWTKISPSDFEGLCYELLTRLRFRDIAWRRGSATNVTTADQGRDLEAVYVVEEPDGSERREKWFVQCRCVSVTQGPRTLQSSIDWAKAERPDVLLVITSSFLSNGAHEWIKRFTDNERPPFGIRVWERMQLENLLSQHLSIRDIERFAVIPSSPKLLFTQALQDWQNHALLASRDRLELFFNEYGALETDGDGRYFLVCSELGLNSYEPERDWFTKFDLTEQLAVLATACLRSTAEVVRRTEIGRPATRPATMIAYALFKLLARMKVSSLAALLWSPDKLLQTPSPIHGKLMDAYRRYIIPGAIRDLTHLVLDRCSEGCRKVDWPRAHEREREDGFIVITNLNESCKVRVEVEDTSECPLMHLDNIFEHRITKRNLQRALLAAALVLVRAQYQGLSGQEGFQPQTISKTSTEIMHVKPQ